jgi:hypothetical protein
MLGEEKDPQATSDRSSGAALHLSYTAYTLCKFYVGHLIIIIVNLRLNKHLIFNISKKALNFNLFRNV